MFRQMDSFMKTMLKYNDYIVVLINLEVVIITHMFSDSQSKLPSSDEDAQAE